MNSQLMLLGSNTAEQETKTLGEQVKGTGRRSFLYAQYAKVYARPKDILGLLLFFGLMLASQLSLYRDLTIGVYINTLTFIALSTVALVSETLRKLALSVAILPITYMVMLCVPHLSPLSTALIYYETLLLFSFIYRHLFKLDEAVSMPTSPLRWRSIPFISTMIVIGQLVGIASYGMLRHHYSFYGEPLPLTIAAAILFAVVEETYFRGLIQNLSSKVTKPLMGAAMSVLMYSLVSISHQSPLTIAFAVIAGIVLSATYYLKQNLVLTSILNASMKITYIVAVYISVVYAK